MSEREFREALQKLCDAFAKDHRFPELDEARALLARPEPEPSSEDALLRAIHHGIGEAILKASSGPGSISLPMNMSEEIAAAVRERCGIEPSPRITREEAEKLIKDYGMALVAQLREPCKDNHSRGLNATRAILTAMGVTKR